VKINEYLNRLSTYEIVLLFSEKLVLEIKENPRPKSNLGTNRCRKSMKIKFLSQNAGSAAIILLFKVVCKAMIKN
jgi:hypothetical protein